MKSGSLVVFGFLSFCGEDTTGMDMWNVVTTLEREVFTTLTEAKFLIEQWLEGQ